RESALKSPIAVSQTLTEIVLPGHIQDQSALNADDGVYDAVVSSTQYNQGMVGRAPAGSRVVSFTIPRGALSSWIINSRKLPDNSKWKPLKPRNSLPLIGSANGKSEGNPEEVLAKLIEMAEADRAVFLRISVTETDRGK